MCGREKLVKEELILIVRPLAKVEAKEGRRGLKIRVFERFGRKKLRPCIVLSYKNVFYVGHIPHKGTICYLNCAIEALEIDNNAFVIGIFKTLPTVYLKSRISSSTDKIKRIRIIYT